ncbi:putative RING-H2 finger protein ATL21A [Henckelia pumila]|uniref:putative RING-H2 finger protein ATL21A n=1 Tax=Henckelia pumila TaxID=405737 RepID=UPI003C6E04C3
MIAPIVRSKKGCAASFCRNESVPIQYPFQLQGQNQNSCDYLALNLTCSDSQGVPLLNLPYFGDVYVRNINYSAKIIQLYEANTTNCLASRFLNSGVSYSPLLPVSYQNYTFFGCPTGNLSSINFTAVGCLSNSTFSVLTSSSITRAGEIHSLGCRVIATVPIPVLSPLQYEFDGFDSDLMLTWDVKTCDACVKKKRHGAGYIVLILFLVLVLPNVLWCLAYALIMGFFQCVM